METLEQIINYNFKNKELLDMALTHLSYANEHNVESYERLEFLGDSILQLTVSEYLYNNFHKLTSGELSKYRSHLVSTKNLSTITKNLHFDKYIKIGKALTSVSDALMADLFESVLAAIYLDGGMEPAKKFVMNQIIIDKQNVKAIVSEDVDYKTELQELLQSFDNKPTIKYDLIDSRVVDNVNYFTMTLKIDDNIIGSVTAKSKKECEKLLSQQALETYK